MSDKKSEKVHKYLARDGSFRVSAVVATQVIEEMRKTLNTYPIATVALGRSMVACMLLAAHQKHGHSVGVYFHGNGPLGVLFAESTYEGASRGYVGNPQTELPLKNGRLDISGGIGIGVLEVVNGTDASNRMQTGTVEIRTGEIGDDIAYYLYQSQQVPSAIVLGVEVDSFGRVMGAAGLLVELLPDATDDTITKIEAALKKGGSISHMASGGSSVDQVVSAFLSGFDLLELEHNFEVRYECRCTLDKVKNALMLMGYQEIDHLIEKDESAEASCDFCGRKYHVPIEELKKLRSESYKRSLN